MISELVWKLHRLIRELRRRHVVRVGIIYVVMGAGLMEFSASVLPRMGLPDGAINLIILLVAIGLPIALVAAWALELSPDGEIQRTRSLDETAPQESPPEAAAQMPSRPAAVGDRKLAYVGLGIVVGLFTVGAYAVSNQAEVEVPAASIRSVAVLPFSDLSAEGGQGYLGQGLAEEVLDALAQVRGLKIAARTSSFLFAGGGTDVREIGERLDVQAVLEGSVTRHGDQLRVRVDLVDTGEGYQIWSGTYDRQMTDLLALQTDIARTIVDTLQVRFRTRGAPPAPVDPAAYDLYLQGRHAAASRRSADLGRAAELFGRALALDPGLARAAAGLAWSHALLLAYGEASPSVTAQTVLDQADAALANDPAVADAHLARAYALAALGRDREAAESFQAAIGVNPNSATAHRGYAQILERNGDAAAAAAAHATALELDPLAGAAAGEQIRSLPDLPGS